MRQAGQMQLPACSDQRLPLHHLDLFEKYLPYWQRELPTVAFGLYIKLNVSALAVSGAVKGTYR